MTTPVPATHQETINALLQTSSRHAVPFMNEFVRRRPGQREPPPLARFVTARRERTLRQYLLVHAVISSPGKIGPEWSSARDSRVWARALRMDGTLTSSRTAVSKGWEWLARNKLVARSKSGRLAAIQLLRDDGSGRPYQRPDGSFFQLPYLYWTEEWDKKLNFSELGVLLIGLELQEPFELTPEVDHRSYGVSRSYLAKGLRGLTDRGILSFDEQQYKAELSPAGITTRRRYCFDPVWKDSTVRERSDEAA